MRSFDAHVHCSMKNPVERSIEYYKQICEWNETEKMAILSIPHSPGFGKCGSYTQNIKTLFYKLYFAPNFYAFAGLEHPKNITDEEKLADLFLKQAEVYALAGYDGIKMLEGAPILRKDMGIPLHSKVYDKFFAFLEENFIPVTMHIANPSENWDINRVSEYAKKNGRFCSSNDLTKAQLHEEVEKVMKKHPKLRLTLAHFGFWSESIGEAEHFLGDYEYTMLDTTPGGEQFLHIAERWDEWESFIDKYQDRILYGSDVGNHVLEDKAEWKQSVTSRPNLVKYFFCTDDEHKYLGDPQFTYKGVCLDKTITEKIFYKNAEREYGNPKPISIEYMLDKISKLKRDYQKDEFEMQDLLFIENYIKGL